MLLRVSIVFLVASRSSNSSSHECHEIMRANYHEKVNKITLFPVFGFPLDRRYDLGMVDGRRRRLAFSVVVFLQVSSSTWRMSE